MGIDTITPQDELVLGLVRHAGQAGYAAITDLHPVRDAATIEEIRVDAEKHAPGYELHSEYGLYSGHRGVKLQLRATEVAVQDAFYDGFEKGRVYDERRFPNEG